MLDFEFCVSFLNVRFCQTKQTKHTVALCTILRAILGTILLSILVSFLVHVLQATCVLFCQLFCTCVHLFAPPFSYGLLTEPFYPLS